MNLKKLCDVQCSCALCYKIRLFSVDFLAQKKKMPTLQVTVYSVQSTLCSVHFTMHTLQSTMYFVRCTLKFEHTSGTVQCTVDLKGSLKLGETSGGLIREDRKHSKLNSSTMHGSRYSAGNFPYQHYFL